MRTNGFALFMGPHARERAGQASARVDRHRKAVLFGPGPLFGPQGDAWSEVDPCFVAYSLEERGELPLVHGFAEDPEKVSDGQTGGEFAYVTSKGGRLLAGRDPMGTRALYIDGNRTCVASDHRFFSQAARLLPRGARMDLGSGERRFSTAPHGPRPSEIGEASLMLCGLLEESVARRVKGLKKVAVSFSGGLDSSIIALLAAKHTEVVLCSAYAERSRDREHAARAADRLGLEHRGSLLTADDAAREVRTLDLPFEPDPMDKALWCLYSTTSRMAAESGAELILLGQLADELFGGYLKYALQARESEASAVGMMERDVAAAADRSFIRDEQACSRFTEVRFPFADQDVADFAMGLPLSFKIAEGERKVILRTAASLLGLPEELARAPKKAAQYSSGLSRLVA
jgi:asparagine synthase (glutamine-hydrolysing)